MMIPIDKMSTTDKVIESIRSYIQEPGRNPGEKLPTENELGKQLGVGRSSIREALRVLQTMGYVTIVHGKGAFIKACQPSSEEAERWFEGNIFALRDIYMVREALEPLIAREAARHITEEALGELRQIIDQTAHAAALPPEDANANLMAQLDEKFHEKICESTNNPFLVSLYKQFIPALHTYRLNSFAILKNCSNVVEPHRRIMEALAQHDAEAADLEMRQHISRVNSRPQPCHRWSSRTFFPYMALEHLNRSYVLENGVIADEGESKKLIPERRDPHCLSRQVNIKRECFIMQDKSHYTRYNYKKSSL